VRACVRACVRVCVRVCMRGEALVAMNGGRQFSGTMEVVKTVSSAGGWLFPDRSRRDLVCSEVCLGGSGYEISSRDYGGPRSYELIDFHS